MVSAPQSLSVDWMGDSGPRDDFGRTSVQPVCFPRVCAALGPDARSACRRHLPDDLWQPGSVVPTSSACRLARRSGALLRSLCGSSPATTGVGALVAASCQGAHSACAGGARVTGRVVLVGISPPPPRHTTADRQGSPEAAQRAQLAGVRGDRSPVTMVRIVPFILVLAVTVLVLAWFPHVRSLCLRWGITGRWPWGAGTRCGSR